MDQVDAPVFQLDGMQTPAGGASQTPTQPSFSFFEETGVKQAMMTPGSTQLSTGVEGDSGSVRGGRPRRRSSSATSTQRHQQQQQQSEQQQHSANHYSGGNKDSVVTVDVTAILNLLTNDSINLLREEMLEGDTPLLLEEEKKRRRSSVVSSSEKSEGVTHPAHEGYRYYPALMEETQLHTNFRRAGVADATATSGGGGGGDNKNGDTNGGGVNRETFTCLVYNLCARSNPALAFSPSQFPTKRKSVIGIDWRSPSTNSLGGGGGTPSQAALDEMNAWENKVLPDSSDVNYQRITTCGPNKELMTDDERVVLARKEAFVRRQRLLEARRALRKPFPPQSNMTETQIKFMWKIHDLFTVIDVNNNGDVSWEEFSQYVISTVDVQGGKSSAEIADGGTTAESDMKGNANAQFNISTTLQFQHTGFTTTSSHRVQKAEMFFIPLWGKYAVLETGEGVEAIFAQQGKGDQDDRAEVNTDSHAMRRIKLEQRNSGVARLRENSRISIYKPLPRVIASVADVLGKEDESGAPPTLTTSTGAASAMPPSKQSNSTNNNNSSLGKSGGAAPSATTSLLQRSRQQLHAKPGGDDSVTNISGPKVETQGHSVKLHSELYSDYPIDAMAFAGAPKVAKSRNAPSENHSGDTAPTPASVSSIACVERKQMVEKNRIKMDIIAAQQARDKKYENIRHRRQSQQLQMIGNHANNKTKNSAMERAREAAAEKETRNGEMAPSFEVNDATAKLPPTPPTYPHLCCSTRGGKLMFLSMIDDPVKEEAGIITPLTVAAEQFLDCDPTALGMLSTGCPPCPIGRTSVLRWDEELPSLLFVGGTNSMISIVQIDSESLLSCTPNILAQYDHHCPTGAFSIAVVRENEMLLASSGNSIDALPSRSVRHPSAAFDPLEETSPFVDPDAPGDGYSFVGGGRAKKHHLSGRDLSDGETRRMTVASPGQKASNASGSAPIMDICLLPERGTKRMVSSSLDGQLLLFDLTTETVLGDFFTGINEKQQSVDSSGGNAVLEGTPSSKGGAQPRQSVFAPVHKMAYSTDYSLLLSIGIHETNPIVWTPFSATSRFVRQLADVDDSVLSSSGTRGARRQQDKYLQDIKVIPGTPYFMTADLGGMMKVWDLRNLSFSVAKYVDGIDSRHDFFHNLGGGQQAFVGNGTSAHKKAALDRFRRKHGQGNVGIFSPDDDDDDEVEAAAALLENGGDASDKLEGTGSIGTKAGGAAGGSGGSGGASDANLFVNLRCRCFGVEPGRGEIVTYSRNVQERQAQLATITGGLGKADQAGPGGHTASPSAASKQLVPGGNVLHCFRALSAPACNPLTTHDTELISAHGSFAANNTNSFGILQLTSHTQLQPQQLSLIQMQAVNSSTLEFHTAGGMSGPLQFSFNNLSNPIPFALPSPSQLFTFQESSLLRGASSSSSALKAIPPFLVEPVSMPFRFTTISGNGIKVWDGCTGHVCQVLNLPLILPQDNEKHLLSHHRSSSSKKGEDEDEGSPHSGSTDSDGMNSADDLVVSPMRNRRIGRNRNRAGKSNVSQDRKAMTVPHKEVLIRCSITACAVESSGRRLIVGTEKGHVLVFSSVTASKIGECRRHQFDWSSAHMKSALEGQRGTSLANCRVLAIFITPSALAPPPTSSKGAAAVVNPNLLSQSHSKREAATPEPLEYYDGHPVLPSGATPPTSKVLTLGQDGFIFVTDISGDNPVYLYRIYVGSSEVLKDPHQQQQQHHHNHHITQPSGSLAEGMVPLTSAPQSLQTESSIPPPAKITVCSVSASLQLCIIGLSNGTIEVRDIALALKHRQPGRGTLGQTESHSGGNNDTNTTADAPAAAQQQHHQQSAAETKSNHVAGTCICILAPFKHPSSGSSTMSLPSSSPADTSSSKRTHHTPNATAIGTSLLAPVATNGGEASGKGPKPRPALHVPLPHKINASSKKTRLAALLKQTREQGLSNGVGDDHGVVIDPSIVNAETDASVEGYLLPPQQSESPEDVAEASTQPVTTGADEVTALITCDPRPFCVSGDSRGFLQVFAVRPHPLATAHLSSTKESPASEDSSKSSRVARWKTYHPRATALVFPIPTALQWVEGSGVPSAALREPATSPSQAPGGNSEKLLVVGDDMGTITVWDLTDLVAAFGLYPVSNPSLPGLTVVPPSNDAANKQSSMSPNTQPKLRANFSIANKPIRTLQSIVFSPDEMLRYFDKIPTKSNSKLSKEAGEEAPKRYEALPQSCFKLTTSFVAVGVGEGKRVSFWSVTDGCVTVPYPGHEPAPLRITDWGLQDTPTASKPDPLASSSIHGAATEPISGVSPANSSPLFPHRIVKYAAGDFLGCLMQGRGTSFQQQVFKEEEATKRGLIVENQAAKNAPGHRHHANSKLAHQQKGDAKNKARSQSMEKSPAGPSSPSPAASDSPAVSVVSTLFRGSTLSSNLASSDEPVAAAHSSTTTGGTWGGDVQWSVPEDDPLDAPNAIIGGGFVIGGVIKMVAWGRQRDLVEKCREEIRRSIETERLKRHEQKMHQEMINQADPVALTNLVVGSPSSPMSTVVAGNGGEVAPSTPQAMKSQQTPPSELPPSASKSATVDRLLLLPGPSLSSLHEYYLSQSPFVASANALNDYRVRARASAATTDPPSQHKMHSPTKQSNEILALPAEAATASRTPSRTQLPAATNTATVRELVNTSVKLHPPILDPQVVGFEPPLTSYSLQLVDDPLNPHLTEHHTAAPPETSSGGAPPSVKFGTTTLMRELSKTVMGAYVDDALVIPTADAPSSSITGHDEIVPHHESQLERKYQSKLTSLQLDVRGPPLTPPPSPVWQRRDLKSPFVVKGAPPINTTSELSNGYKLDERGLNLLQKRCTMPTSAPTTTVGKHNSNNNNNKPAVSSTFHLTQVGKSSMPHGGAQTAQEPSALELIPGPKKTAASIHTSIVKNALSASAPSYHKSLLALEADDSPRQLDASYPDGNTLPLQKSFLQDSWRRCSPVAVLQRLVAVQGKLLDISEGALSLSVSSVKQAAQSHYSRVAEGYQPQVLFPSPASIFTGKGEEAVSGGVTPMVDALSLAGGLPIGGTNSAVGNALLQMVADISKRPEAAGMSPNELKKQRYQCSKIASALETHMQTTKFPGILRRMYQYYHGLPVMVDVTQPCLKSKSAVVGEGGRGAGAVMGCGDHLDVSVGDVDNSPLMVVELPTPTNHHRNTHAALFQHKVAQRPDSAASASADSPASARLKILAVDERVSVEAAVQHRQLEEQFFDSVLGWTREEDFLTLQSAGLSFNHARMREGSSVGGATSIAGATAAAVPFWQVQLANLLLQLDVNHARISEVHTKLFSDISVSPLECTSCVGAKATKPVSSFGRVQSFSRDSVSGEFEAQESTSIEPLQRLHSAPYIHVDALATSTDGSNADLAEKRTLSIVSTVMARVPSKGGLLSATTAPSEVTTVVPTAPLPTNIRDVLAQESRQDQLISRKSNPYEIISRFVTIQKLASGCPDPVHYATDYQLEERASTRSEHVIRAYIETKCGHFLVIPSRALVFYRGAPVPLAQPSNSTIYNASDVSSKQHDNFVTAAVATLSHLSDLVRIIVRQRAAECERLVEEAKAKKRLQNRQQKRRHSTSLPTENSVSFNAGTSPLLLAADLSTSQPPPAVALDASQLSAASLLPLSLTIPALSLRSALPLPFLSLYSRLYILLNIIAHSTTQHHCGARTWRTPLRNEATISAPLPPLPLATASPFDEMLDPAASPAPPISSRLVAAAAPASNTASPGTSPRATSLSPPKARCRGHMASRSHANSVAHRRLIAQQQHSPDAADGVVNARAPPLANNANVSEEEALRLEEEQLMAALQRQVSHVVAKRKKEAEVDMMMVHNKVAKLIQGPEADSHKYQFVSSSGIKDQLREHLGSVVGRRVADEEEEDEVWEVTSWRPKTPTSTLRLKRDLAVSSHSGSVTRERPPTPPSSQVHRPVVNSEAHQSPARPSSPGHLYFAPQLTPVDAPSSSLVEAPSPSPSRNPTNGGRPTRVTVTLLNREQQVQSTGTRWQSATPSVRARSSIGSHPSTRNKTSNNNNNNNSSSIIIGGGDASEMPNFFGGPGGGLTRRDMLNVLLTLPKPTHQDGLHQDSGE